MTTCIPRAQGVPGLPTAPNWFDNAGGATPPLRKVIDDPRWTGAYSRGFGDGTGLEAQFRGVYMNPDWRGRQCLFLSWNVPFDMSLDTLADRVYVGFNNGGANDADTLILSVEAYASASADLAADPPGAVQAFTMNATTGQGTPLATNPPWLADTKAWLKRSVVAGVPHAWAVQMVVPYDPAAVGLFSNVGIKLPDPFRMFYQIYVLTPTRISGSAATGGFVTHKWPLASPDVFSGLSGDVYPHPPSGAGWDAFHPSTGPGDPICPVTGGVTILASDLGNMVDGGAPGITIKYRSAAPQPVNTLFANVNNSTGAALAPGSITARFRIADWGSVIMDPGAPWDDIRGGATVGHTVPIPVGHPAVTAGNPPPLHFTWQLTAAEMAPYLAGKPADQCILVELTGAGIEFFNDSARQNHLIVPASTVTRRAQISVEGLAPLSGSVGRRDVYVAIETRNMPAPGQMGGQAGDPGGVDGGTGGNGGSNGNGGNAGNGNNNGGGQSPGVPAGRAVPALVGNDKRGDNGNGNGNDGNNGGNNGSPIGVVWDAAKLAILRRRGVSAAALDALRNQGLIAALDGGQLDLATVADLQPTYNVHVYHDTGNRLDVGGVRYPILAAQSSFGLLPDHVGDMTGWRHQLNLPAGALQDTITPNFMRLHVPDNGKIHAEVHLEAVEPGGSGGGGGGGGSGGTPQPGRSWKFWGWLLLVLILLWLLSRLF